jgi:hypothetical protein
MMNWAHQDQIREGMPSLFVLSIIISRPTWTGSLDVAHPTNHFATFRFNQWLIALWECASILRDSKKPLNS